LDQAASYITGESVGAAQEYCRCAVVGVLVSGVFVVGMLLAEVFG
jgi:hypothetical protein